MSDERAKRKLSAVLSADVKGYSRLMGEDETGTVSLLKEYREIMGKLIQQHRGRVVDSTGDNLLAEFSSVVDAVDSAVEIQKQLKLQNEELPENRRMEFRIGVNLGDVVEDEQRIYGDGVNIAARVESLTDGGGICISGTAYDQIGKKLPFGYEYLGEQTVKNIEKPVRIYRVLTEPEAIGKVIGEKRFLGRISRRAAIAAIITLIIVAGGVVGWNIYLHQSKRIESASLDKMAYPLPAIPSIAVLPFDNLSKDPKQAYLADAITENIIAALSKVPGLFVIARNSTFIYKGKPVKVQKVAEELGVRYVVEGSIQCSGDRVRVIAQFIDALNGKHLWAEKYDRVLKDIFSLQDEISMKIITSMRVKLKHGIKERIYAKSTTNLEAYLKWLQGSEYRRRGKKEDNLRARQLYREAIGLDPEYTMAYVSLGWTHMLEARYGWSKSRSESIGRALELAKKIISMDEKSGGGYGLMSYIYRQNRDYEKAIAAAEKQIDLEPNNNTAYANLAAVLYTVGRGEEAVPLAEKAIRLDPNSPWYYFHYLGNAYLVSGRYEEAIVAYKKALHLSSENWFARVPLTASYIFVDREDEARAEAAEILRLNPKFSVDGWIKRTSFKDQALTERYANALRKAGLN
jgi:adenylate cyclase